MYACVFYSMPEELENELNLQILPIIAAGLFITLVVFGAFAISVYLNGAGAEAPTPNMGIASSYIYPTEGLLQQRFGMAQPHQTPDIYPI